MSAARKPTNWISPEEYIEAELLSEIRHEYFDGEIVAMAQSSLAHNRIAGDLFVALNTHLQGKRCEAFANDMKAHISKADDDWFYYPDVMVNCDPSGQQQYYCETPSVIVEVLSPATERIDRREKRMAYEMIPTLHSYILVSQDKREVTIFRRKDGAWTTERLPEDGTELRIPELEFTMSLDAIYTRAGVV